MIPEQHSVSLKTESYLPSRECGITLLELMITLTVVAIGSALAVPSLNSTIERNRILTAKDTLISSLYFARNEALKRGHKVIVCPSQSGTSCSTDINDWATHILVLATTDKNGKSVDITTPDAILLTTPVPPNVHLNANSDNITFRSDGTVNQLARFTYCDIKTADTNNTITVNYAGRFVREKRDASPFCSQTF